METLSRFDRRAHGSTIVLFLIATLFLTVISSGQSAPRKKKTSEPQLLSVFPWVAQTGQTVQAEVRGNALDGASAVWFEDEALRGRVVKIELAKPEPDTEEKSPQDKKAEKVPVYLVSIEIQVAPGADWGNHAIRLITPGGLSNPLPFRVVEEPVVIEDANPHQSARTAQPVRLPVLLNGRLDQHGQLDFYSFDAKEGEQISVQVVASDKVDAHVTMFRQGGSWFDPDRPTRLLFQEDRSSDLMPVQPSGTLRVPQNGRYFLQVTTIYGKGTPDSSYLLRMASGGTAGREDPVLPTAWRERNFQRRLGADRIRTLEARTVPASDAIATATPAAKAGQPPEPASSPAAETTAPAAPAVLSAVVEHEPNDLSAQALTISIPAAIEGAIERPGDVDSFKFTVKAGQRLAIEIETPGVKPPEFNPRLSVVDGQDRERFSNLHRGVSLFNANADRQPYLKRIEPKAIYTFDKAGEYILQVRDITSRYGRPDFRYRICVRPQVAHVGEVLVSPSDRVNLVRGQTKKLTITASHEEGFKGDITFYFAGLPEGVMAFPAAEVNDKADPTDIDESADAVAAKVQTVTVVLMADAKAEVTAAPKVVELLCRPIVNGYPGPNLLVSKIPIMVVEAPHAK